MSLMTRLISAARSRVQSSEQTRKTWLLDPLTMLKFLVTPDQIEKIRVRTSSVADSFRLKDSRTEKPACSKATRLLAQACSRSSLGSIATLGKRIRGVVHRHLSLASRNAL